MAKDVLTISGPVRGKPRPRLTRYGGCYYGKDYDGFEAWVRSQYHGSKHTTAVSVTLLIQRPLPASRPKSVNQELDMAKPDVDNIAKCYLDALNGAAYEDDRQIVELRVLERNRRRGAEEQITIIIEDETERTVEEKWRHFTS